VKGNRGRTQRGTRGGGTFLCHPFLKIYRPNKVKRGTKRKKQANLKEGNKRWEVGTAEKPIGLPNKITEEGRPKGILSERQDHPG